MVRVRSLQIELSIIEDFNMLRQSIKLRYKSKEGREDVRKKEKKIYFRTTVFLFHSLQWKIKTRDVRRTNRKYSKRTNRVVTIGVSLTLTYTLR